VRSVVTVFDGGANRDLPADRRLRVCLVTRDEPGVTGTSRYAECLVRELLAHGVDVVTLQTRPVGNVGRLFSRARRLGPDLTTFFASYPLRVTWPAADVYHLTVQTYAALLVTCPPPGPSVVTVHDIIPWLVRHDRRITAYRHPIHALADRLAMRGLMRATRLVAVSAWTGRSLVDTLGIPANRVAVVPLGVNTRRFRPLEVPSEFRRRCSLDAAVPHLLYVGSDDPRKNLDGLLRAFARVRREQPSAVLLLVGASHQPGERRRLRNLVSELGLDGAVRWLDQVAECELPLLYNAADVLVQPSHLEGFGLPVLEALACGTRVVCSDRAALPELAAEQAVLCSPTPESLASAIGRSLADRASPAERERRSQWALRFTWERMSLGVLSAYRYNRAAAESRSAAAAVASATARLATADTLERQHE
jgi:glycosyltransferase involved in cell wall biosynthesis